MQGELAAAVAGETVGDRLSRPTVASLAQLTQLKRVVVTHRRSDNDTHFCPGNLSQPGTQPVRERMG
jgi:hypothetical protein